MQLETKEPVHARLTALGAPLKDLVRLDAAVVADTQGGCVHERDAGVSPFSGLQVITQGNECRRHQFHETLVADETGERPGVMLP